MKKIIPIAFFSIWISLCFGQEVKKSVLSSGATEAKNSQVQIKGTFGQPITGISKSSEKIAQIGFWSTLIDELSTSIEIIDPSIVYPHFSLGQNFPNPAQGTTTVEIGMPSPAQVVLQLYSLQGKLLGSLVNEKLGSGKHLLNMDVSRFPAGKYFYVLLYENRIVASKKMVIAP